MRDLDEMRNIDLDYEPVVIYKKKGGIFEKFVSLLLGVVLGVGITVGGVAGVGYYGYTQIPIQDANNSINDMFGTNFDYSQYINGAYGEKTIEYLVGDVIKAVEQISNGEGSLNTLNDISPLVKQLVVGDGTEGNKGLVGILEAYAIIVDPDEAMKRILVKPEGTPDAPENKDVYLTDYIKACVDDASLGDMMQAFGYELNDVIKTICYGSEGVDYTVDENGKIQMLNGAKKLTVKEFLSDGLDSQIKLLPIDSFIPVKFPTDTVMCMLAYGPEYRYEKTLDENGNVVMKQVFYEGSDSPFLLKDDEGNDVTANITSGNDNPQNGIVLTHTYTQNGNEITETRYLQYNATDDKYYAFEDEGYTTPILFKKNTIGKLNEGSDKLIDGIYVKDLLKVTEASERVMISLCYGKEGIDWQLDSEKKIQMLGDKKPRTVKDLKEGNLFNQLTLYDLLGKDVGTNKILDNLKDKTVTELPEAMKTLTFEDVFHDNIYLEDGTIDPMWLYLFDKPETTEVETPDMYTLLGDTNSVDTMVENMQHNMQNATLAKLATDGLITFDSDKQKQDFFDSTKTITVNGTEKAIQQLTITEMINYIIGTPSA